MDSFVHPFTVHDWSGDIITHSFREYANVMMRPDPTLVELSNETEAIINDWVNAGGNPFIALSLRDPGYRYTETGREYIVFPSPDVMRKRLACFDTAKPGFVVLDESVRGYHEHKTALAIAKAVY